MNYAQKTLLALGLSLPWSSLSTLAAAQDSSLSGVLTAPAGSSVEGSLIVACAPVKGGCDDRASRSMDINVSGSRVEYRMKGVPAGSYTVLAWKDLDGDGEVSSGDLLASFGPKGQEPTRVRPGTKGVNLTLSVYRPTPASAPAQTSAAKRILQSTPKPPSSASGATASAPASVPGKATPYTLSGTVTDSSGKPLAGVEVFADNTLYYNINALATTDAQGRYTLKLPKNQEGTWKAGAYLEREYHGQDYRIRLYADSEAAFASDQGAVRNFVWKLSGKAPGGGKLGSVVYVYGEFEAGSFEMNDVEFTLTPDGPLIDGSAGKPLVRRLEGGQIADVPVGRYRMTAVHKPPGRAPQTMRIQPRGQNTFAASATADFRTSNYGTIMEFVVRLPE